MTVDDRGFPLDLAGPPQRIISLVPSLTETLVDLGVEDRIVGLTKFCIHPEHLRRERTRVGGTKGVRVDVILDLQPDLRAQITGLAHALPRGQVQRAHLVIGMGQDDAAGVGVGLPVAVPALDQGLARGLAGLSTVDMAVV